jgi:hypothetical protein
VAVTAAQYAALLDLLERQLVDGNATLEQIADALTRIADQGDNHLNPKEPNGETPPPRPVP